MLSGPSTHAIYTCCSEWSKGNPLQVSVFAGTLLYIKTVEDVLMFSLRLLIATVMCLSLELGKSLLEQVK